MKKLLLLSSCALATSAALAQQTEFSVHLTSGGAAFRGASAESNSFINYPTMPVSTPYTNGTYGRRLGLSYGAAGQVQRVGAAGSVLGAQAGYEQLRSRVRIDHVLDRNVGSVATDGRTMLVNSFITLHPFFGHRFAVGPVAVDLTAGPEVGLLLRSHEQGEAVTGGGVRYATDLNRDHPTFDLRARANLTAYYQHFGLSLGYSYGLTNYKSGYVGGMNEAYLQAFRVGLVYRINGI